MDLSIRRGAWQLQGSPTFTKVVNPENGVVIEESYRLWGKLHRHEEEGPALIRRDPNSGREVHWAFYWYGLKHRVKGAAEGRSGIGWDTATYYRYGVKHRTWWGGPASQMRSDEAGLVSTWYLNGEVYRDPKKGPCRAVFRRGKLVSEDRTPEGAKRPSPPAERARREHEALKAKLALLVFAICAGSHLIAAAA